MTSPLWTPSYHFRLTLCNKLVSFGPSRPALALAQPTRAVWPRLAGTTRRATTRHDTPRHDTPRQSADSQCKLMREREAGCSNEPGQLTWYHMEVMLLREQSDQYNLRPGRPGIQDDSKLVRLKYSLQLTLPSARDNESEWVNEWVGATFSIQIFYLFGELCL